MADVIPDDVLAKLERHGNPGLARSYRFMGLQQPEVYAEGVYVTDASGRRYLDFSSGYGVMVHGYRHPKLVATAKAQLDRLTMSSRVLPSAEMVALAERLAELTAGRLSMSFFCNSGAEAIEAVLKFARLATGRRKIVSTLDAFHGKTLGALSVSGRELYQAPFRPLLPDVVHIPYGDLAAAEAVVDQDTALVLVEPIQGEGGIVVPPDGYLRGLRNITRRVGALLAVDEVQTGMGRTGYLWAYQYEADADPDLLASAKGLGGGIVPIGAVLGTPEVFGFWDSMPLIHTSTFGGNPLATAVAKTALDVLVEEDLPGRAQRLGVRLAGALSALQRSYPRVISETRGRGLLFGLVTANEGIGGALMSECLDRQLLVVYTLNNPRVLRLMPPLVIGEEELEEGLRRLEAAVRAVDAMVDMLS